MQFSSEQFRLKVGLAEMLKGGVIMDVTNLEQAVIAEAAWSHRGHGFGAGPIEYTERGRSGAHGPDRQRMREIMETVSIPSWPRLASARLPKRGCYNP